MQQYTTNQAIDPPPDVSRPHVWPMGGCPVCGDPPIILNVHKAHFGVCHKHKVKWSCGRNIMSGWEMESQEQWDANAKLLFGEYISVEPVWPTREAIKTDDRRRNTEDLIVQMMAQIHPVEHLPQHAWNHYIEAVSEFMGKGEHLEHAEARAFRETLEMEISSRMILEWWPELEGWL